MKYKKTLVYLMLLTFMVPCFLVKIPVYAVSFAADPTNRVKMNFNTGWTFFRGDVSGGEGYNFDDTSWEAVNLPHSVRLEPKDCAGINTTYQGICWYRRNFTLSSAYSGKKVFVEFQGAMTTADVWINGNHIITHHGGYLPFTMDITNFVYTNGTKNVIAVKLDNSDDSQTPPGKPQNSLDFKYFGGIYRDVNMYITDKLHVTDTVYANKVADGGVFVSYPSVSQTQATVQVKTNVKNEYDTSKNCIVKTTIVDYSNNQVVSTMISNVQSINPNGDATFTQTTTIDNPKLWSPNHPNLYMVYTAISDGNNYVDDYKTRIGIRRIQFTPDKGFFINGEHVLLNGANRHQEYLYVGNAMCDSGQYRDAKQLKEAGFNIVRAAHYPNDPAFLDACDELGLTVVECNPSWQFFGDSTFQNRAYQDIRDMVRRDRNHPSIILWESSLNETNYTYEWAQNAHNATHQEYPGDQCYTSGDYGAYGKEIYDVAYKEVSTATKPLFTREWGDEWSESASSTSGYRSMRRYGETDMISSCDSRQNALNGGGYFDWCGVNSNSRISGYALWSYNDYRGCAPDIVGSGIVDVDRYPKFNYYFLQSQRDPNITQSGVNSGPMIFIANNWTSNSPKDVKVFSNCQQVKLYLNGRLIGTRSPDTGLSYVLHPMFTFQSVPWEEGTLKAEGLINGTVVATYNVSTPGAPHHLSVEFNSAGKQLVADGSDIIPAYITVRDVNGNIVPTATDSISLQLSGPGILIGNGDDRGIGANPVKAEAGIAPALIKSTLTSGTITLSATLKGLGVGSAQIVSVPYDGTFVPGGSDERNNPIHGINIALNKNVMVSSEEAMNPGSRANDGNEATRWCAADGTAPQWWQVDLGTNFNLTGTEVLWEKNNTIYNYKIEVSEDQSNWVTVVDKTQNTSLLQRQADPFAAKGRYVRITTTGLNNAYASFYEFKVFGVESSTALPPAAPARVNVSLNKAAIASSSLSGTVPSKSNDGSSITSWEAASSAPQWWKVDLGNYYDLSGCRILWGRDSIHYNYRVEVSTDGSTWVQVISNSATGQNFEADNFAASGIRYLRINIDSLSGGTGTERPAIKEVEAYCEPVNIAVNKNASTDSYQVQNPASAGNDGNNSTRWCAYNNNGGHWWQVDLGRNYDISGTEVKWELPDNTYNYKIEVSDDNINWRLAVQNTSTQQVRVDNFPANCRYVRITVIGSSPGWASFWEFKVYGTDPTSPRPCGIVPHSQMTATASSYQPGDDPKNAIDENNSTLWHTRWDLSNPLPQSITLNLGGVYDINKITYLPRQDGSINGIITGYKVYTSTDGTNFAEAASGTWAYNSAEKTASFASRNASYVRLEATAGGGGYASAAEINVYQKCTYRQDFTSGIEGWNKVIGTGTVASEAGALSTDAATSSTFAVDNNSPSKADGIYEFKVTPQNSSGRCEAVFRYSSVNSYAAIGYDTENTWVWDNGQGQYGTLTSTGPALASGTTYTIKVKFVGSNITLWVDDTQIYNGYISQLPTTSGQIGVRSWHLGHMHFDDIAYLDN